MKKESEAVIQQQIYIYFHNTYRELIIHSVPNGIPINTKDTPRMLDMLHKTGMVNGISDLIIHGKNGRCIMVEVKNSTGVQSEAQRKIQSKLENLNGIYLLVRSLEDFKEKINIHLDWLMGKE